LVLRVGRNSEVRVPRSGKGYSVSFDPDEQRIISLDIQALDRKDETFDRGMVRIHLLDIQDDPANVRRHQAELSVAILPHHGLSPKELEPRYRTALQSAGQILAGIVNQ